MFSRTKGHFDKLSKNVKRARRVVELLPRVISLFDLTVTVSFLLYYIVCIFLGIGTLWINIAFSVLTLAYIAFAVYCEYRDRKELKKAKKETKKTLKLVKRILNIINLSYTTVLAFEVIRIWLILWVGFNLALTIAKLVISLIFHHLKKRVRRFFCDLKDDVGDLVAGVLHKNKE